jgi:hypothetical protein
LSTDVTEGIKWYLAFVFSTTVAWQFFGVIFSSIQLFAMNLHDSGMGYH